MVGLVVRARNGNVARTPVAGGEIVTVLTPGEGRPPLRKGGRAIGRIGQLAGLLADLAGESSTVDELAFRKSLEARHRPA